MKLKIEKPDKIVDIVEKILQFNGRNEEAKVLKILTPDQMISRLPITLGRIKAFVNNQKNNSEKTSK